MRHLRSVDQSGDANEVLLTSDVAVSGNAMTAEQNGDINLVDILLAGNSNTIEILQNGAGNWVAGDDGYFAVAGNNGVLAISQQGNDNLVLGSQAGDGNIMSVTQVGDFNTAIVVQN